MKESLPEIRFKGKKERKGGFLGWLRGRAGFCSKGAIGEGGINPAAMNIGRSFGTSAFGGSSGGIAGFLAGNIGAIATVAIVAVAGGIHFLNGQLSPVMPVVSGFDSYSSSPSGYIPAILRNRAANNGSSLDLFRQTNQGYGKDAAQDGPSVAAVAGGEAAPTADPQASADQDSAAPGQENPVQEAMARLQGGEMTSLTSSLGSGSGKFSALGGFGNKFGSGQAGLKPGFTTGIGAGFAVMPKFDSRKNKMLAMKGSVRPVLSKSGSGKAGKIGPGAFGQAKGIRDMQKSYAGSSIDAARSTQDKAWEGATSDGEALGGGAGLSEGGGGAGIVSSPSLDNLSNGVGGGTPDDAVPPDAMPPIDISPWAGLLSKAMMLIMISAALSAIGGMLVKKGRALMSNPATAAMGMMLYMLGMLLAIAAMIMALMAIMIGMQIISAFGQAMLGSVYLLGGGVAMAAAVMAMTGASLGPITPMWMSAIAGVIAMMASMFAM